VVFGHRTTVDGAREHAVRPSGDAGRPGRCPASTRATSDSGG
jgi:hypothetical protein